jgi:hypothetical protein
MMGYAARQHALVVHEQPTSWRWLATLMAPYLHVQTKRFIVAGVLVYALLRTCDPCRASCELSLARHSVRQIAAMD